MMEQCRAPLDFFPVLVVSECGGVSCVWWPGRGPTVLFKWPTYHCRAKGCVCTRVRVCQKASELHRKHKTL